MDARLRVGSEEGTSMMLKHSLILVLMIAGTSSAVSSLSFHVRAGRPSLTQTPIEP